MGKKKGGGGETVRDVVQDGACGVGGRGADASAKVEAEGAHVALWLALYTLVRLH